MNDRKPSHLRTLLLLLLLAVGPLQVQAVFACAMMEKVVHDTCCCDDHLARTDCVDSSCDTALGPNQAPCCERSVQVSVDDEARHDSPLVKPVEVRSGVDPPQAQAFIASFDVPVPPQIMAALAVYQSPPVPGQLGSDTYLITQRLRI